MSCALVVEPVDKHGAFKTDSLRILPFVKTCVVAKLFDVCAEVALTTGFINRYDNVVNTTFMLPLVENVILYDIEILVDGVRRILGNNVDEYKLILENRIILDGKQVFCVGVGEVPPGKEVSVKCTYAKELSIEGDALQFVLPSCITPNKPDTSLQNSLCVSLTLEAHNSIIDIASSHPSIVSSTIGGNKAKVEAKVESGFLSSDLIISFRIHEISMPRVWTCVGTSGDVLTTRASVLVLQPPINSNSEDEGEVIFYVDLRSLDLEVLLASISGAFARLPSWAVFNVWICSGNATSPPQPIFEQPLAATNEHFEQAHNRLKFIKPFLGDESAVIPGLSALFATQISQPPRVLLIITDATGVQVDNILKVASAHTVTTRSVVLHLLNDHSPNTKYVRLLKANGSDVLIVDQPSLERVLPDILARNVKPTQSLTISWKPEHTYQVPRAPPPLFLGSQYLLYAISAASADVKKSAIVSVQLGDGGDSAVAKPISSSILHRMASAALLNEIYAGVRTDLNQNEQTYLANVLYSSWSLYESKERPQLLGAMSEPSISLFKRDSNSNLIASMRSVSGPLDKAAAAAANFKTMPSRGARLTPPTAGAGTPLSLSDSNMDKTASLDVRQIRLRQMKSTQQMFDLCPADYAERAKIPVTEAEATILEQVVALVMHGKTPGTKLSRGQAQSIRAIVTSFMEETNLAKYYTNTTTSDDGSVPELEMDKLKLNLQHLCADWKFNDVSPQEPTYTTFVTAVQGARPHMEDNYIVIDYASDLFGVAGPPCSFFGVFDGHSGKSAADFCKTHLAFNIFRDSTFNAAEPSSAITAGYLKTDAEFLAIAKKEKRKAGSTAVTLLVCGDKLVVSNAGDSEAVMCRSGVAACVSTVHTPANEREQLRVVAAGGKITNYGGTQRVGGILAVTRSFGDIALKAQVIAEPDTYVTQIGSGDEFIVLATDGLYEVMNYQEVVDFVRNERANSLPMEEAPLNTKTVTEKLAEEALRRGSKDNITALVVFFKQ